MPDQNDYRVAVFGAGGVGKSSIVLRFMKGTFADTYVPTIEDTYQQVIGCNKNSVCTLHITDTTGSHQFPAMQRLSASRGHAFVLVYSVTSRQSLDELEPIQQMIKEVKGQDGDDVPVLLVGNKVDEEQNRRVSTEIGRALASKWNCAFIETSAKLNKNIDELFETLFSLEKQRSLTVSLLANSKEISNDKKSKGFCCIL